MIYRVRAPQDKRIKAHVRLPGSKSISNRLLIIRALSGQHCNLSNLSEGDDTQAMLSALNTSTNTIDVGHAGTTMRFLTAYLAIQSGEFVLTGSPRMCNRPIGYLVSALKQIGAEIDYLEKAGYPPLKITGNPNLSGRTLNINSRISSQFISALCLIAPYLKNGLEIKLNDEVVSREYIEMTLKLMRQFGIEYHYKQNFIKVFEGKYTLPNTFIIPVDWSAASYIFEIAALSKQAHISIKHLHNEDLQPDAAVQRIFKGYGVECSAHEDSTELFFFKTPKRMLYKHYDMLLTPDLTQTLAITLAALDQTATLDGIQTLRIKETNRIEALKIEMQKLNVDLSEIGKNKIVITPESRLPNHAQISTYKDHRMAMAFAPLALKMDYIDIENPSVVEKSFPNYWAELQNMGFSIETINTPESE